jgi:CBS domain-containing protein
MMPPSKATVTRRRVAFRRVNVDRVGDRNEPVVFCPRKLTVLPVAECRDCPQFAGLCVNPHDGDAFLRCAFANQLGASLPPDATGDTKHELLRTPVSEIMSSPVKTVTATMCLADMASMFLAEQIGALPVVDGEGKAIGIVTRSDALEHYYDDSEAASFAEVTGLLEHNGAAAKALPRLARAETMAFDLMTHAVFSMQLTASISSVAALMAYERVHHVVVVDADRNVIGIVSALDIARWLARADGFVVPKRRRALDD